MDILVIQCFNALLYASILFLIAGGLSLIYGVMRIVNLAHGTLYAIGAYMAAWLVGKGVAAGLSPVLLLLLLPVGAATVGVVGAVMEPTLLRPMYRRAEEYQLLVTFGLLLMLEDAIRFVWGGTPLSAAVIMESLGSLRVLGARYPTYNLVIIAVGLVSALLFWAFVYRTKFGVLLRATSQDMRMASSLGVNVRKVYVQAFALGCTMAGLGGAIIVPGQAAVLGMGTDALILAFVVVVVGGLGSLLGALIGALIVGVMRTVGIMFFPEIELAVLYLIAAVVLLVRPTGLFGAQ
jgi:branched-chain amino acid transport system permease protein